MEPANVVQFSHQWCEFCHGPPFGKVERSAKTTSFSCVCDGYFGGAAHPICLPCPVTDFPAVVASQAKGVAGRAAYGV